MIATTYNPTLGIATVIEQRSDYRTEQAVNAAIEMRRHGRSDAEVVAYLNEQMVKPHVIAKVLDGRAIRRT